MKKIISLLVATALSVSAFASVVSAAQITSANKATLSVTCEEVDWTDALASAHDFTEGDDDLYSCYRFTITAGNLPELKYSKKKYDGEGVTYIAARFDITTEAEKEVEWDLFVPAGQGAFSAPDGDINAFSYNPNNGDPVKLVLAEAVGANGSKNLVTFDMVIDKSYDYTVEFVTGNMAIAEFDGTGGVSSGQNAYDVAPGANNLTVSTKSFSLPLSSTPDPVVEEPGIAPAEEVEAKAIGAAEGYYDIAGNAVTSFSENYGITKFSTALDTANKKYYLYITDTSDASNMELAEGVPTNAEAAAPFLIDFDAEKIETSGTVQFFALVHSTTHVIKSIRLLEVAK